MRAHYSDTLQRCVDNFRMRHIVVVALLIALFGAPLHAAERRVIGLTQKGKTIEAIFVDGESQKAPVVVLVGSLNGSPASTRAVEREAERFEALAENRRAFRLIVIPNPNTEKNPLQFPPMGNAYRDNTESHVLWRWIGSHAPDLTVVAGDDFGLVQALSQNPVAGFGKIPAIRVGATSG